MKRTSRARAAEVLGAVVAFALMLVILCSIGCASAERKLVTSANDYTFWEARYEEACVAVEGPAACEAAQAALVRWKGVLVEAGTIVGNGGAVDPWLSELKKAEAAARAAVKRTKR